MLSHCPKEGCAGHRDAPAGVVPLIICPEMPKGQVGLVNLDHLEGEPSCPLLRKDP